MVDKDDDINNEVNETPGIYNPRKLIFFKSLEEMNEHDDMEMASFTPIERLQHITELLKHTYADELKKKMDLTIHFK